MFIIPGKPGPFGLTATVEGVEVHLMRGREDAPQNTLGALPLTEVRRVLKELKDSLARPNPLATKWGMAGIMAFEAAQQAGFKGRPSVLADLIDTSGMPPMSFVRALTVAAKTEPRLMKMPFSGAFARLLRDGMSPREAATRLAAVDSGLASGFGGKHGANTLAQIVSGGPVGAEEREEDVVMVINLTTGEISFPPGLPKAAVIRRAMEILLQVQAQAEEENK